jgi:hypothetical protein
MFRETELFEFTGVITLNICFSHWIKKEVRKTELDTRDELLECILDAAACLKKSEDQLRRTTPDLRTRVAKCTEVPFARVNSKKV